MGICSLADGHEPNKDFGLIMALDKMAEDHQINYKFA